MDIKSYNVLVFEKEPGEYTIKVELRRRPAPFSHRLLLLDSEYYANSLPLLLEG